MHFKSAFLSAGLLLSSVSVIVASKNEGLSGQDGKEVCRLVSKPIEQPGCHCHHRSQDEGESHDQKSHERAYESDSKSEGSGSLRRRTVIPSGLNLARIPMPKHPANPGGEGLNMQQAGPGGEGIYVHHQPPLLTWRKALVCCCLIGLAATYSGSRSMYNWGYQDATTATQAAHNHELAQLNHQLQMTRDTKAAADHHVQRLLNQQSIHGHSFGFDNPTPHVAFSPPPAQRVDETSENVN